MQTAVSLYNDELLLGNIADTSLRRVDSYLAQGAVGIGKLVVRGTDPARQAVQVGTGAGQGALVIGASVLSITLEQSSAGVVQYADKDAVPVMTIGRIVLETDDAVVAGTVANLKLSNGKVTDAAVAAGIEAFTLIRAKFVTGTTAAGLAIVEISNP